MSEETSSESFDPQDLAGEEMFMNLSKNIFLYECGAALKAEKWRVIMRVTTKKGIERKKKTLYCKKHPLESCPTEVFFKTLHEDYNFRFIFELVDD